MLSSTLTSQGAVVPRPRHQARAAIRSASERTLESLYLSLCGFVKYPEYRFAGVRCKLLFYVNETSQFFQLFAKRCPGNRQCIKRLRMGLPLPVRPTSEIIGVVRKTYSSGFIPSPRLSTVSTPLPQRIMSSAKKKKGRKVPCTAYTL